MSRDSECRHYLNNGNVLICQSVADNQDGTDYVRIENAEGVEVAYWYWTEWREDPQLVMGALMGALNMDQGATPP